MTTHQITVSQPDQQDPTQTVLDEGLDLPQASKPTQRPVEAGASLDELVAAFERSLHSDDPRNLGAGQPTAQEQITLRYFGNAGIVSEDLDLSLIGRDVHSFGAKSTLAPAAFDDLDLVLEELANMPDDDYEATATSASRLAELGQAAHDHDRTQAAGNGAPTVASLASSTASRAMTSTSTSTEPEPEPEPEPETEHRWLMPFENFQALRRIFVLKPLIRDMSARSRWLVSPEPGVGAVAVFPSINNNSASVSSKENRYCDFRHLFPTRFPAEPTASSSLEVTVRDPAQLPRWKDRKHLTKATPDQNLVVLASQVAGVAFNRLPSLDDLGKHIDHSDVGMFRFTAAADLEARLLAPSAHTFINKKLIRRLQHISSCAVGLLAWRREPDGTLGVYGVFARCGLGAECDAASAVAGRSFSLALHRAGVSAPAFKQIPPEKWAALYGADRRCFGPGWTKNWPLSGYEEAPTECGSELADEAGDPEFEFPPGAVDPIEIDLPSKRFRTREEVNARHARAMGTWNDYVERSGLPAWFGGRATEVFAEVMFRSPGQSEAIRVAKELLDDGKAWKSKKKKQALATIANIRQADDDQWRQAQFYRGSPLQFASLVLGQGRLLDVYCDAKSKSSGMSVYQEIRDLLRR